MLMLIKDELQIYIVPTGKRPGGLTYVLFIVVANAHGEEFHDLPAKFSLGAPLTSLRHQETQALRGFCYCQHELMEITGAHSVEEFSSWSSLR